MKIGSVLEGAILMGSVERYGVIRVVLTVVNFRDVGYYVFSALIPIGAIIIFRGVCDRWRVLMCYVRCVV